MTLHSSLAGLACRHTLDQAHVFVLPWPDQLSFLLPPSALSFETLHGMR